MKRLLLIILFLIGIEGVVFSQFKFGAEAGYLLSNKIESSSLNSKNKHGFVVSGTIDYLFTNKMVISSGISYISRRTELTNFDESYVPVKRMKVVTNYFQLPVTLGYGIELNQNLKLTPKVGGYIAAGLNGKGNIWGNNNQTESAWPNVFTDNEVGIGNNVINYRPFNRFDTGLKFKVDLQYKPIVLGFGYDFGLVSAHSTFGSGMHVRSLYVTLGYIF